MKDPIQGALVVERETDSWLEHGKRQDLAECSDGPLVHPQYKHASVEAIIVLSAEYVVIVEVGGREEDGPGDFGVHDDTIAVEPPAK